MSVSVYYTLLLVVIAVIALYLGFTAGTPAFPGATVVEILSAILVIAALAGIFVTRRRHIEPNRAGDRLP